MKTATAFLLFFLACGTAAGQAATSTADQGMRLQTYVLGSYSQPKWFTTGGAAGATVGASLNIFHFGRIQPGVDVRASTVFGPTRETFVGAGPRVQVDFGRLHPYANYLFGYGSTSFTSGSSYTHDNASVSSIGGGVDYQLGRAWSLRFDVQHQNWAVTQATHFSPNTVSVGLRYQFHFRNKYGPE